MKIIDIHNLAIKMGMDADFRGRDGVQKFLDSKKKKFEKISDAEKNDFDKDALENPYSDSGVHNISEDKEIKKVLVGIDTDTEEILLSKHLQNIDLVIGHHPIGKALSQLADVMDLQCDIFNYYGVPINVAEGLMRERISEIERRVNPSNHQRPVDAAKLLKVNLMNVHTPADNLAAKFLKELTEEKKPETIGELVDMLKEMPEYKEAIKIDAGPKIFVGFPENRCGKIAFDLTGGTECAPKLYEKMSHAGVGTIVGMHASEEHKKEAEAAHVNIVIAGHISSDSLGMNLFLDELEKQGIEIVPCSGFTRFSRISK
ncbi:MAG: NGG1p interacting factor NIF3 [Candidatus Staskawiczbacteria bacterium]|jgi:putative NIF3 family GTP cyclohydrolase 1 type 2